jgi:hypothetical protein
LLVLFLNKGPQMVCVVCCPTLGNGWLCSVLAGYLLWWIRTLSSG